MAQKATYFKGIGKLAEKLGRSPSVVSGVVHGHRKSKKLAIELWVREGIRSKGQGLDYKSIPRGEQA
jgi:hypothetical protein